MQNKPKEIRKTVELGLDSDEPWTSLLSGDLQI